MGIENHPPESVVATRRRRKHQRREGEKKFQFKGDRGVMEKSDRWVGYAEVTIRRKRKKMQEKKERYLTVDEIAQTVTEGGREAKNERNRSQGIFFQGWRKVGGVIDERK